MSTGGSFPPWSWVTSPAWAISGKCRFVTDTQAGTISLAHRDVIL
jgi:hypothetical protein